MPEALQICSEQTPLLENFMSRKHNLLVCNFKEIKQETQYSQKNQLFVSFKLHFDFNNLLPCFKE